MKRFLLLIFIFAVLLCPRAQALDVEEELYKASGAEGLTDALPQTAAEMLGTRESLQGKLASLGEKAAQLLFSGLRAGAKSAALLLAATVAAAAACALFPEAEKYIGLASVSAVAAILLADTGGCITAAREAVRDISAFSNVLLPVMASASAAAGAAVSAGAQYAAAALFMNVFINLCAKAAMPLVFAYLAACIGAAAFDSEGLSAAAKVLKWGAVTVLTAVLLVYAVYLTVTSAVSQSADAAAVRTAKSVIGMFVPVVGGMIADASSSVLSGAALLRSYVGGFGIAAAAAICAGPFIRTGAQYIIYKLSGGLCAVVGGGRSAKLIYEAGSAFGILTGLIGAMGIMLFVYLTACMRAVSGA
ncbi:MAG: hypothetical protein II784_01095 [Oscillospiraceae bacterium]|nr:hypothetical protein [Oscillospiraceae bacterium]